MLKKKDTKIKTKDQKRYNLFKINLIILIVLLVLVLYFVLNVKPTIIGNAGGVIGVDFSVPIAAFQLDKTSMTFAALSETQTLLVSTNDNKVYKNAYYSTGTTWNKFQLSGTTLSSGWITGAASKTLSLKASDLNLNDTNLSKTLHVITYSCTKLSRNKFDCRNNLWQLKDINVIYQPQVTQAATPTASPVAGTYTSAQSVTLTSATSGASIYYTTNGSTPTTSSTLYSSAINVSSSITLKAIAVKSGYSNSSVLTSSYIINSGTGKTYYVSSSTGNDDYNSTQAQNPATPWRTITKVNAYTGLVAGDSVLFKRGEIFDGNIVINKSGSSSLPITYSAYGAGDKPIINGFTTLTNWTLVSTGVYQTSCTSCATGLNMVTVNGINTPMGRTPNTGYLSYESFYGATTITDNELSSSPNWTGAEVVIRHNHWILTRHPITSHSNHTLTYGGSRDYNGQNDYGYFIQNDPRTLDQLGEWYFNPTTKNLQMYFGSNSPSNYVIKASTTDYTADISSKNYIVLDNLSLQGANVAGVNLYIAHNNKIQNCDVYFSGRDGILAWAANNFKVENNNIQFTNNGGINIDGDSPLIRNNTVQDIGIIPGMGDKYQGIRTNGPAPLLEYNTLNNLGYVGITFSGYDNAIVRYNVVRHFCQTVDDGGGIYTWTNSTAQENGMKVYNNIVLYGGGANELLGTPSYTPSEDGIYMDGLSNNVEIYNNTVAYMYGLGIHLNTPRWMNIHNNTIYDNNVAQIQIANIDDSDVPTYATGNIITNNIFYSKTDTQSNIMLVDSTNNIFNFGTSQSNNLSRPINNNYKFSAFTASTGWLGKFYNITSWRSEVGQDSTSTEIPITIPKYTINNLVSQIFPYDGNFTNSMGEFDRYTEHATVSLDNGTHLDGKALQVSFPTPTSPSLLGQITGFDIPNVSSNKNYILKFSTIGTSPNKVAMVYLQGHDYAWNPVPYVPITITTTRTEHEILFSHPQSSGITDVMFYFDDNDGTFWLDNFKFYEADVTLTNPDDYIRLEYNDTNAPKTISLGSVSYMDVYGTAYTGNVTLQPYTSLLLTKN